MLEHLIEVSKKQSIKLITMSKDMKIKVLNKSDTDIEWYFLKEQEKIQSFYNRQLIRFFIK
jgi:hypothetical protein